MKSQGKIEARSKNLESRKGSIVPDSRFLIPDSPRKPKVFVGLSGGVDSAVSAALLKQQGFDVTGVFIKAWQPASYAEDTRTYTCTWKEDRRSAMKASAVLDIPFIMLDLEKEYKEDVVDYMIEEYRLGRTPNPDVMCNKEIKFGHFLKFALLNGADFVATGHYARKLEAKSLELRGEAPSSKLQALSYVLGEGKDKNKDQSYFLWTLTQDQLRHILFPVGHLQKSEVRKLAHKFGLPQETRKDSQGLCFLGHIDMKEFLKTFLDTKSGDVLNKKGEVIGRHDGALLYTTGERHGFKVLNARTESEPLYVVAKDIDKNTITVATKNDTEIDSESLDVANRNSFSKKFHSANWIAGEIPKGEIECRLRYRQTKIKCKVEGDLLFLENEEIAAPGQSVVFYSGEICLGGAIIGG